MIKGGRIQVRTVWYMAMMSAMQCNPVFKEMFQRFLTAGKPKKDANIPHFVESSDALFRE